MNRRCADFIMANHGDGEITSSKPVTEYVMTVVIPKS
jgi:hypothetical protein